MDRRGFLKSLAGLPLVFIYPWRLTARGTSQSVILLETRLAGFQYYNGEKLWDALKPGQPIFLKRQPHNPYDEKAIEIYWQGQKLGYMPRADNVVIANLMDQQKEIRAFTKSKNQSPNPWERVV